MTATVKFVTGSADNVLTVPTSALRFTPPISDSMRTADSAAFAARRSGYAGGAGAASEGGLPTRVSLLPQAIADGRDAVDRGRGRKARAASRDDRPHRRPAHAGGKARTSARAARSYSVRRPLRDGDHAGVGKSAGTAAADARRGGPGSF